MRIAFFISAIIWIILALCIIARADTIGGVVVDNETMQVISGVPVDIRQCHCGSPSFSRPPIKTTTTDKYGSYEVCVQNGFTYKVIPIVPNSATVYPKHRIVDLTEPCIQ